MAVGSGLSAQLVATDESTYGVAPSLASARSYEIKSETLKLHKNAIQGQGLHAGGLYPRTKRRVVTDFKAGGNIMMDLPTRQLAYWLQHMVGSFGQSNATPTQVGVSGVYKSIHQSGSVQGHSLCVQKGVPAVDGTVEPFTYVGAKVASWELTAAVGALAELSLTLDARNELAGAGNGDPLNGSVPGLASFATPTTGLGESVFHFREATVLTGGTPTLTSGVVSLSGATAAGNIKDVKITQALSLENNRLFIGTNGFIAEPIENGLRKLGGSFTVEWLSSEAYYNAFLADTTTSLQLTFTGATVSTSNYLLDVIIPNIKLDGETPSVSGPAVVMQSLTFTGSDDESTVPIQFTYQSEDTAI